MQFYDSCSKAAAFRSQAQTYSVAHLLNSERTMDMHVHNYCEVYY